MEWGLLVYRLPTQPSRGRVAVWRELRRLGALPLQQSVVAFPLEERWAERLDEIELRITAERGTFYRFRLELDEEQETRLRTEWNALREQEYAEIIEECETKFAKEIEFEIFRGNLTAGESEEIEADLEKIRNWFARIADRDLFAARNRGDAERAIEHAAHLLEDFVGRVFRAEEMAGGPVLDPPLDLPWGEIDQRGTVEDVVPIDRRRRPSKPPAAKKPGARRKRKGREAS